MGNDTVGWPGFRDHGCNPPTAAPEIDFTNLSYHG